MANTHGLTKTETRLVALAAMLYIELQTHMSEDQRLAATGHPDIPSGLAWWVVQQYLATGTLGIRFPAAAPLIEDLLVTLDRIGAGREHEAKMRAAVLKLAESAFAAA